MRSVFGVSWWIPPVLLALAAIIQSSFLPALGLVQVRPDLVLAIVVIWAVLRGVREALPWALLGGLLADTLSGGPFGASAFALVIVAFCSSAGEAGVFRNSLFLPLVAVFWSNVLYGIIMLFLLATFQQQIDWLASLRHIIVPGALATMVATPLLYFPLSRLERRTRRIVVVEW